MPIIAIIVYNQDIDGQSTECNGEEEGQQTERLRLHIVGEANRDDAVEKQDADISQPVVGQGKWPGRIGQDADRNSQSDPNQLPPAVEEQSATAEAGKSEGEQGRAEHGSGSYPALSHGAFGTQAVFAVRTLLEIEVVVSKIAGNLGEQCHEET